MFGIKTSKEIDDGLELLQLIYGDPKSLFIKNESKGALVNYETHSQIFNLKEGHFQQATEQEIKEF